MNQRKANNPIENDVHYSLEKPLFNSATFHWLIAYPDFSHSI